MDQAEREFAAASVSVFGGYVGDGDFAHAGICSPTNISTQKIVCGCDALGFSNISIFECFTRAEALMDTAQNEYNIEQNYENSLSNASCALQHYRFIAQQCCDAAANEALCVDLLNTLNGSQAVRFSAAIGRSYMSFEDCHPDHDLNDLIVSFRMVHLLTAGCVVNVTTIHLEPKARGAGFMHQLLLSLDGRLDAANSSAVPLPPPLTPCDSEMETTMKPPNANTTNFLRNGTIYASYLRTPATLNRTVTAAAVECIYYINPNSSTGGAPASLPQLCNVSSNGTDSAIIPNDYETLPPIDSLYVNTFPGSSIQSPSYRVASLFQYQVNNTLPVNDTMQLQRLLFRFYLRNTDCLTNIDLIDLDPHFLDASFRPWGIVIAAPNFWRWPLEGIPVEIGDVFTGQCVGGERGGLNCTGLPLQCPLGVCNVPLTMCAGGSNAGGFCNYTEECPYGMECFTEVGAYPLFDNYYECFKQEQQCCENDSNWFDEPLHKDCRDLWCLCDPPFNVSASSTPTATFTPSPTPTPMCKLFGEPCGNIDECCSAVCYMGFCM